MKGFTFVYEVSSKLSSFVIWLSRWIKPKKFKHMGGVNLHSILNEEVWLFIYIYTEYNALLI